MVTQNVGKVIQIAGPAVDVEFSEGSLPPIYQALRVTSEGFKVPDPIDVVLEVRKERAGPGRAYLSAGGQRNVGPGDERDRRAGGPAWPGEGGKAAAHP